MFLSHHNNSPDLNISRKHFIQTNFEKNSAYKFTRNCGNVVIFSCAIDKLKKILCETYPGFCVKIIKIASFD